MDQGDDPRVMGKGKGKEVILRYNGEVINGEHPTVLRDPRKARLKKLPSMRSQRMELVPVKYEYDEHSVGPPPPASVLVMNLSVLTAIPHMRHHFSAHGSIKSLELHLDHKGGPMGIVTIRYNSHEEARGCVEKEHGRPLSAAGADFTKGVDGSQQMLVVFDGEGNVSKAVLKEIEGRRLRELDEKRRKGKEEKARVARAEKMRMNGHMGPASHNSWKANQQGGLMRQHQPGGPLQPIPGLPDPPFWHTPSDGSPMPPTHLNGVPSGPKGSSGRMRKAPQGPGRGRQGPSTRPSLPVHFSISTPMRPWARQSSVYTNDRDAPSPSLRSRSPSPVSKKSGRLLHDIHEKSHEEVVEELARNGFEHVTIDGHGSQLGGAVREEDVRHFFEGFKIDKVLRDKSNWYVTFETGDSARRAALVLNSGARTLGHHSVNVTVHPAPASPSAPSKARWNDDELVEQAEKIILKDLRAMLEKDVVDKVVASGIRHMILDEKTKRGPKVALFPDGHTVDHEGTEPRHFGVSDLRGLSFRKQKKRDREENQTRFESLMQEHEEHQEHPGRDEERPDAHVSDRPHKRQKKTVPKTVINEDIESEDEAVPPQHLAREDIESEDEETPRVAPSPLSKKTKMMRRDGSEKIVAPKKAKKSAKKKPARATKPPVVEEVVHEVQLDDFDFDIPTVTQVRLTPTPHFDSSASPPSSPVRKVKQLVPPPPPLDPIKAGICEDDEDLYFVKVALARDLFNKEIETTPREPTPSPDSPLAFRVHITGSARTEGYYSISHAEKSAYVTQYASRGMANKSEPEIEQPQQNIESSRSNRANARRRAQGLEEINQVQRALALSKGESAATELLKFNQLQTRKKHLRFARSPIHDWGLYAMEKISRGEMVIEYVGEIIRAQVADKREKAYERQGIGSSYLFRIDEDLVVDATKKGNLGRLINHSCDPNCTAKIITINGEKKIVIYAKQDIELGSEITYDYHFPIEQDKIPCLCGSTKCRGYLN
ncbi:uncharacterized protein LAESUDRAFT_697684 [Laetiporus sulphureus 93-53]|uniref:Histone-lysine N-methyltransferase, H3 lysine-4 specific n=1 Tax=Laetiporus sulphureus 93-53 TaxID=1314785 RepID=A0A165F1I1_9APHY|nr:uncharacterized protein LAESUDRAFT_697684 [Laetiporus sulphureus 93-53]KZT08175.1 hypothetical protein LAESUDRAFT_697684 [Laetiporus sulphureus 93-53]